MKKKYLLILVLMLSGMAAAESLAQLPVEIPREYTLLDSVAFDHSAMLLLEKEDHSRFFCGCIETEEGWQITLSSPLPADTGWDAYHAGPGSIALYVPAEADSYTHYVLEHHDGKWLVATVLPCASEAFALSEYGISGIDQDFTGTVFGTFTLPRDITQLDWSSFPDTLEEALSCLANDWGVVAVPSTPLYADSAGTQLISNYSYGTPVQLLDPAQNASSTAKQPLVRVSIAGSETIGWIGADAIHTGHDQLLRATEEEGGFFCTASRYAPIAHITPGAALYTAPDTLSPVSLLSCDSVQVLSETEGWLHVLFDEQSMQTGYLPSDNRIVQ